MNTLKQTKIAAADVKSRHDYTMPAAVYKLWVNPRRFIWGFNFRQNVRPGDMVSNGDGTRCEIVAIV